MKRLLPLPQAHLHHAFGPEQVAGVPELAGNFRLVPAVGDRGPGWDNKRVYTQSTNNISSEEHDLMSSATTKKRIYNPVTERYYEIRQNSSKYEKPGQIKGLWSLKKKSQR